MRTRIFILLLLIASLATACGSGGNPTTSGGNTGTTTRAAPTEKSSQRVLDEFSALPPSQVDDFSTHDFGYALCTALAREGVPEDDRQDRVDKATGEKADQGADTNWGVADAGCEDANVDWKAKHPEGPPETAEANVREAVPAMEAYWLNHNNDYTGATTQALRSYDSALKHITIVSTSANAYCIQSTVGAKTYHEAGPAGNVETGHCPPARKAAPPSTTQAAGTDGAAVTCSTWKRAPNFHGPIPPPSFGSSPWWPPSDPSTPVLQRIAERARNGQSATETLAELASATILFHPYWWFCSTETGDGAAGRLGYDAARAELERDPNHDVCLAMDQLTGSNDWNSNPYCPDVLFGAAGFMNRNKLKQVAALGDAITNTFYCVGSLGPGRFRALAKGVGLTTSFTDTLRAIVREHAVHAASNQAEDETRRRLLRLYNRIAHDVTGLSYCANALADSFRAFSAVDS